MSNPTPISSMIAQLSSSIKGFSLNNSSYSEMVDDQCSFCKGHHAISNSPSTTTNQLRSLPCGHILCCNCLNDSLAELGIQSNEIEDILPIDSAVNNYNGSQIIIYQCPLCQTSLTILPKRYENELSREIIQSEINNSSSSSDDEEKEDFDDENRKLIQQITSLFDSGPPEIESTNSLNLLNTSCSFHNEPMKWFCFTCNQVACDECISQATHRMHEFSLCRNAAPTLRVTLQDTCNEIHQKSEKINQKLIEIQSRNENVMYINLQNSIQEHCDNLRAAVDVLQQKLIENVEFLKNNPKEVNRLKHELSILQEVESTIGDTSNPESLGDINVCVLVSKLHESHLLLNQNHDINQLNSCDDDVPIPSLKKNKKSTTKLYEMIRDSASVYSPRQSSPYEDHCSVLYNRALCGNKESLMKLEEMSKAGKLVCLGYLTLLYSYDQALLVKCKKLARKVYPLLLKCIENDEKQQYLGLNKHQLYIFGMLSCKGLGCHKNLEDAFNCFRLSSMDNYPPSICQLASFYEHGVYVTQDSYLAFKLYQLAATLGEPVSQYKLAFSYTSGLVVPSDYCLSFYYFYLSAKQGYKPAIHNLFLLFVIISVLVCWILGIILFILFAI